MAEPLGLFDPELVPAAWATVEASVGGGWDEDLAQVASAAGGGTAQRRRASWLSWLPLVWGQPSGRE